MDVGKLVARVEYEASRSGEQYPHIYGKLNLDAVVRVRGLRLGSDGKHTF